MINQEDSLALKIAMLVEGTSTDMKIEDLAKKYGYTREHYYHLKRLFEKSGSAGLIDKKSGPKENTKRTEAVNNQIIRFRFLDSDSSSAVISQKLKQMGYKVSARSVSRTIAEFGLQKKTI